MGYEKPISIPKLDGLIYVPVMAACIDAAYKEKKLTQIANL